LTGTEPKRAARGAQAELERRIAALESVAGQGGDLDAASIAWLLALGVALPAIVLTIGWFL
jgi:hypothetical protein